MKLKHKSLVFRMILILFVVFLLSTGCMITETIEQTFMNSIGNSKEETISPLVQIWEPTKGPVEDGVIIAGGEDYGAIFPDIINIGGELLVVYYNNIEHAAYDATDSLGNIEIVRSTDNGKSWSEPQRVLSPEILLNFGIGTKEIKVEARDPNFTMLKDGTLMLTFFTRQYNTDTLIRSWIMTSPDNGWTWDEPQSIPCHSIDYYCGKRGTVAVFDDGQILIPMYGESAQEIGNSKAVGVLAQRTASGEWRWLGEFPIADNNSLQHEAKPNADLKNITINEVAMVCAGGDRVLALARQVGLLWMSENRGRTWDTIGEIGQFIHQPNLYALPDGRIFVLYALPGNIYNFPGRRIYGRVLDFSLGNTPEEAWNATQAKEIYRYVERGADNADPSMALTADGKILIVHYLKCLDNHYRILGTFTELSDWATS